MSDRTFRDYGDSVGNGDIPAGFQGIDIKGNMERLSNKLEGKPVSGKHKWDKAGERCLNCGAKDWMDDPECRGKPMIDTKTEAWDYFEEMLQDAHTLVIRDDCIETIRAALQTIDVKDTPAHVWKEDPHKDRYNCKRSELPYGHLTDDALANAMYLCDHRTNSESLSYLDGAKNRIRWLSRQLEKALNKEKQCQET